jgi:hypothetical protein
VVLTSALVLRVASAAVIAVLAGGKLARLPDSATLMWRPAHLHPRVAGVFVTLVATFELGLALTIVLAPQPVAPTAGVAGTFFLIATVYGTISIDRSGACGCSGSKYRSTRARLWVRNMALLVACLLGLLLGPTLEELPNSGPGVFLTLALIPACFIVLAVLRRLTTDHSRQKSSVALP